MQTITFKYAPKIKPVYLDHIIDILLGVLDYLIIDQIVDFFFDSYDDSLLTAIIAGLLLSILFDVLFSFGKTIIDFQKREIRYCPALTFPKRIVKIDEIESVSYRKKWYDRHNILIKLLSGKMVKVSVDDSSKFLSLLSAENENINIFHNCSNSKT